MREGPFWDVMAGRVVPPPAAVTLGWQLIAVDPDAGTIQVAFRAAEQFLNPVDVVQGGFLAAMLEPVFAQHKAVRGFDRFVCRGQRMCATEWKLMKTMSGRCPQTLARRNRSGVPDVPVWDADQPRQNCRSRALANKRNAPEREHRSSVPERRAIVPWGLSAPTPHVHRAVCSPATRDDGMATGPVVDSVGYGTELDPGQRPPDGVRAPPPGHEPSVRAPTARTAAQSG